VIEDYGARLDEEGRRLLAVVRKNTLRMSKLIDDLLAFSRTARSELRHARVAMTDLARSVFEEIVPDPGARARIGFSVGDLPPAEGDAALLRQVWFNLLSNAVKYSAKRPSPVIAVSGALEDGQAVYRVRDNGAGFDMQYAGKLFGVFQRLHAPDQYEGTGIGLALVQRIVARHGGRVAAHGEVDRGATFSFSLPAADPGRGADGG
jgi:light-regulated signal transduction histidine kinase (bacteriophytochrome)